MMKSPRNMMATPEFNREDMTMPSTQPHIKDIGPHEHAWRTLSADGGLSYQECTACHTRRVLGSKSPSAAGLDRRRPVGPGQFGFRQREREADLRERGREREEAPRPRLRRPSRSRLTRSRPCRRRSRPRTRRRSSQSGMPLRRLRPTKTRRPARRRSRKSSGARCRLLPRSARPSKCRRISSRSARGRRR